MQSKFNGGRGNKKIDSVSSTAHRSKSKHEPPKEEFSGWPQGLLAIGTFGNPDPNQNPETPQNPQQDDNRSPSEDDDLSDFTPEEVGHLQKELTKLLKKKPAPSRIEGENADLPLDRFLNCPSSLEVDRRISSRVCGDSDDHIEEEDIDRTIRVIIDRCKDVCMEKNKKAIGEKSISFLLRKVFVCRGGFAPSPSLRDSLQESRMETLALEEDLLSKLFSSIFDEDIFGGWTNSARAQE